MNYDRKFCQRITDESWLPIPNIGRELSWNLERLIGGHTGVALNRVEGPQVQGLAYRIVFRKRSSGFASRFYRESLGLERKLHNDSDDVAERTVFDALHINNVLNFVMPLDTQMLRTAVR